MCVQEGCDEKADEQRLDDVYTQLYVTTGGDIHINAQHEVTQIDMLNLLRGTRLSLAELTHKCIQESRAIQIEALNSIFTALQSSGDANFDNCKFKLLFILDGLDESRLEMDTRTTEFQEADIDVKAPCSVEVLLTNLINRSLLPSARLWITTRPAAANQIHPDFVDMRTEVRGFTDVQKEEYFRRKFKEEEQACRIISHIKASRSLHIMCHIPIFCWVTAKVFEDVLKMREELPKTLTAMYISFLVVQSTQKNKRGDGKAPQWSPESCEMIPILAKLAFEQLQKGNVIFYESDLRDCGITVRSADAYSGVFTQMFRRERGLFKEEADFYQCAVDEALQNEKGHLDLFLRFLLGLSLPTNQALLRGLINGEGSSEPNQEIIGYIKRKIGENLSSERIINLFHCLNELNDSSLVQEWSALGFILLSSGQDLEMFDLKKYSASEWVLLRLLPVVTACRKAMCLQVFCRCLQVSAGVLQVFCRCLQVSEGVCRCSADVLQVFCRCLQVSAGVLQLSAGVLQVSAGVLQVFCRCSAGVCRLSHCNLRERSCEALSPVLSASSSSLLELDLRDNELRDSGLNKLSVGLKSPNCRLEILRLSGCLITAEGCSSLASALRSNPTHLKELDLSFNHPGDDGTKQLSAVLEDPELSLEFTPKNKRGDGKAPQWSPESCEMIPILAKLPFEQLQKGNVIFYESDLRDCGITVRSADAYSGVFTQMFRRERGLFKEEALLRGLINGEGSSEPNQEIIGYIKEKIGENLSSERIINLFHCLNELNDSSLVQELQQNLRSGRLTTESLSSAQWSALGFILLSSGQDLEMFDLKKYSASEWVLLRLLPVVTACRKAMCLQCSAGVLQVSAGVCRCSAGVLQVFCRCLQVSAGVLQVSAGVSRCLQVFYRCLQVSAGVYRCLQVSAGVYRCLQVSAGVCRFCRCLQVSASVCRCLQASAGVLQLFCRCLQGSAGVQQVSAGVLQVSAGVLQLFCRCSAGVCRCLQVSAGVFRCLQVSAGVFRCLQVSAGVQQVSAGVCRCLQVSAGVQQMSAGVQQVSAGVLQGLQVSAGVLQVSAGVCRCLQVFCRCLQVFSRCSAGVCRCLRVSAGVCMCLQVFCRCLQVFCRCLQVFCRCLQVFCRCLQVSAGVLRVSAGVCGCLQVFCRLSDCNLTERSCEALSPVLSASSSSLLELDLIDNELRDSGLNELSVVQAPTPDPELCINELLISEESLRSNPTHLKELDLSFNHPGDVGTKQLSAVLEDPELSLEVLRLDHCGKERLKSGLKKYHCELSVDTNTVHRSIQVSNNRVMRAVAKDQQYPDHPERFQDCPQLLCSNSLTGRCYWEVEWSGRVHISVAYKKIRRHGSSFQCQFGRNQQSWSLVCTDRGYSVLHDDKRVALPHFSSTGPRRVAVFVNYPAGTVTFYRFTTDTPVHLYTFKTTFTEPLFPGFGLGFSGSWFSPGSSVHLCSNAGEASV
ncbi:Neoverrucotoxin subunit alpha [Takifugu flavidus]|uniref:Neoverrucotoxin subunit alpha n=2 Tax=Takifugu flavidus TaxID=433684 RepID=A0A5C6N100_9TELE|nr:Neoverrucotoxin subunit alpha [Takifugu flavidus]